MAVLLSLFGGFVKTSLLAQHATLARSHLKDARFFSLLPEHQTFKFSNVLGDDNYKKKCPTNATNSIKNQDV